MTASLYMFISLEASECLLLFSVSFFFAAASVIASNTLFYVVPSIIRRLKYPRYNVLLNYLPCVVSSEPSLSLAHNPKEEWWYTLFLFVFFPVKAAKLARYTAWQCLQVRAISVPPARSANLSRVNDLNNYDHAYNERFRV